MENTIDNLINTFESHAHRDEMGVQFWYARELKMLLKYRKWENFKSVIEKAKIVCKNSGFNVESHWLPDIRKSISGKGKEIEVEEYQLTRYDCYLIAQNGDSRKKTVAFAQTYFAVQTRRKELEDQALKALSSEQKRMLLRNELKHGTVAKCLRLDHMQGIPSPKALIRYK